MPGKSTYTSFEQNFTTGIDEAGRGPLAGPVVSAAVTWPHDVHGHQLIKDSKKLTEKKREEAFAFITRHALDWSFFTVGPAHIDKVNIRQATLESFQHCFEALKIRSEITFIDGKDVPYLLSAKAQSVIKGDQLIEAISCASIIAKVIRDRIMKNYDLLYPQYGFKAHKGYGTKAHYKALCEHGPTPIHRHSFQLIK